MPVYDFKGNLLTSLRQFISDTELLSVFSPPPVNWEVECYRVDWTGVPSMPPAIMDARVFETNSEYDAPRCIKNNKKMIKAEEYISLVETYFSFLKEEFDFAIIEIKKTSNSFYSVRYGNENRVISISYENIEDYFTVIIFILANGELPNYDDKERTLHLDQLTQFISSLNREEINKNNEYFKSLVAKNELNKKILKSARELRLYLRIQIQ
jgi:hypothetical protein